MAAGSHGSGCAVCREDGLLPPRVKFVIRKQAVLVVQGGNDVFQFGIRLFVTRV